MQQPAGMAPESVTEVKEIKEWIDRISKKIDSLGDFPICPYAKDCKYIIEKRDLSDVAPVEGVDVAIFVVGSVTLSSLLQRCTELNMRYPDYVFLDDHADDPTFIGDHQTNYGKNNLILVQRKDELLEARKLLFRTKYYENWSDELYNKIVEG